MSLDGHDKLCGYQKAMFPICIYIIILSVTLASLALPNEVWNELNFFSLTMSIGAMENQLLHYVLRLTKSYMMSNFDICPIIVNKLVGMVKNTEANHIHSLYIQYYSPF